MKIGEVIEIMPWTRGKDPGCWIVRVPMRSLPNWYRRWGSPVYRVYRIWRTEYQPTNGRLGIDYMPWWRLNRGVLWPGGVFRSDLQCLADMIGVSLGRLLANLLHKDPVVRARTFLMLLGTGNITRSITLRLARSWASQLRRGKEPKR